MLDRLPRPLAPFRSAQGPSSVWLRIAAVPAVVALTLLGVWVFGGVVTNDFGLSTALTALWFCAAGAAALAVAWRWRRLALPVLGTYVLTAGVVGGYLAVATFVGKTVVEAVAAARPASEVAAGADVHVELARGAFEGIAHETSGDAAVVRLQSGQHVLQLLDFRTDAGPDLRVYLVAGSVDGESDPGDFVDIGALRGNEGTQQYDVPAGVDTGRYSTVLVWCRAFSVPFGAAELAPS